MGALSSRSAQPSACSRAKPVRGGAGAGGAPTGGGGGGAAWQVFWRERTAVAQGV